MFGVCIEPSCIVRQCVVFTGQAVHELEAQHEEKLKSLSMKLQQEKTERLEQMKTSLTAEKQVLFNEALNKVSTCMMHSLVKGFPVGI